MTGTRPAKPWRVDSPFDRHQDGRAFRGQSAAYDAVAEMTRAGRRATVFHWEDGSWRLYEVIEAPAATEATTT